MHEESNEWSGDVLQRKKYADFLTQYLVAKKDPFVININAPWGSGKTFFIEHWCEDLKKEHPCVLFNAWENDFSNDPLLSVISHIKESLQVHLSVSDKENEAIKSGLFSIGRLVKSVIPILAKAAASKAIGESGYKEISDFITEKDEESVTAIVGKVTEELVENNKAAKDAIKNFQISLADLIEKLTCDQGYLKKPLFIFIDELDRCRPLYAIELLERIKHLFGVPGIVFVIATDTEQLKHSVNAIYGSGFDSNIYLRRFFDQNYTLSIPNFIEYAKLLFQEFDSDLIHKFVQIGISPSGDDQDTYGLLRNDTSKYRKSDEFTLVTEQNKLSEFVLLFSLFSIFFSLDLRTQKQCYEKILAIIPSVPFEEKLHFVCLVFLIMLEAKDPLLFKEYFLLSNNLAHDRKELIRSKFSSFNNVRIKERPYCAIDFVGFYSQYAFVDNEEIKRVMGRKDSFTAELSLLKIINENSCDIKLYEQRVLFACNLS